MLNFNRRQIPDEELFLLMSQGDKQAQAMLFQRYGFLGRQITGALIRQIRQENNVNITCEDFQDVIEDCIFKSIRYYSLEKGLFYVFTKDILNQTLSRVVKDRAYEKTLDREILSLDCPIKNDTSMSYHEVIAENQLTSSEQYDLDNFLDVTFSSPNSKRALAGRIYTLYHLGFTLREIAKKLKTTVYEVRNVLNDIAEGNIIIPLN